MTPLVDVILYSRRDCCLCDEAKEAIAEAERRYRLSISVREVDIDGDPELHAAYDEEVPVIFIGGRKAFKYRVDAAKFADRVRRLS